MPFPSPPMPVHIEFIGLPGAGKSLLALQLARCLNRRSVHAMTFKETLNICLRRAADPEGGWKSMCKRILFSNLIRRFWPPFLYPKEQVVAFNEFLVAHPNLFECLARVFTTQLQHRGERERIFRYLFNELSGFQLATEFLQPKEALVWDEGFCHRALTIWGRLGSGRFESDIQAYIASIPLPDRVYYISADPLLCIERMNVRGFAPFVEHHDQHQVIRKMERLQNIALLVCEALKLRGVPVETIQNKGSLAESIGVVENAAESIAAGAAGGSSPA